MALLQSQCRVLYQSVMEIFVSYNFLLVLSPDIACSIGVTGDIKVTNWDSTSYGALDCVNE